MTIRHRLTIAPEKKIYDKIITISKYHNWSIKKTAELLLGYAAKLQDISSGVKPNDTVRLIEDLKNGPEKG